MRDSLPQVVCACAFCALAAGAVRAYAPRRELSLRRRVGGALSFDTSRELAFCDVRQADDSVLRIVSGAAGVRVLDERARGPRSVRATHAHAEMQLRPRRRAPPTTCASVRPACPRASSRSWRWRCSCTRADSLRRRTREEPRARRRLRFPPRTASPPRGPRSSRRRTTARPRAPPSRRACSSSARPRWPSARARRPRASGGRRMARARRQVSKPCSRSRARLTPGPGS